MSQWTKCYTVVRYKGRYWAVYDLEDELVCVTVYRKGAYEVAHRLAGAEGSLSRLGLSPDQAPTVVADHDRDTRYLSDIAKNSNDRKKGQYQYG